MLKYRFMLQGDTGLHHHGLFVSSVDSSCTIFGFLQKKLNKQINKSTVRGEKASSPAFTSNTLAYEQNKVGQDGCLQARPGLKGDCA